MLLGVVHAAFRLHRDIARSASNAGAIEAPLSQPQAYSIMTVAHFHAPDAPGFRLDPRVIAAFGRFAGGFWRGRSARAAWGLSVGLGAALLLSTAATVGLNQWNRWFFDSLEAIGVAIVLTRETLQVRWRAWIVEHLVDRWLARQRFYHLNVSGKE